MPVFNIWIEGHRAQGSESQAKLIARIEAPDFRAACVAFSKTPAAKGYGAFDESSLSFWGCGLFDNEADARKNFG